MKENIVKNLSGKKKKKTRKKKKKKAHANRGEGVYHFKNERKNHGRQKKQMNERRKK